MWLAQKALKRKGFAEAVSLSILLEEDSSTAFEEGAMNRCVLRNIRKFSSRSSRRILDAATRHRTFAEAGEALNMSQWGVTLGLRQMGKDAACIERLAKNPWPVIFDAAVLDGKTLLYHPTLPFYAALPLQRQTSSQWGLSIGSQRYLTTNSRRDVKRYISVRLLKEGNR
jgi:hypothetical protein